MSSTPVKTLGEVANIDGESVRPEQLRASDVYVGLENIGSDGELINLGSVAATDLRSNKYRFDTTHVLFGKLRPYLAKVARPNHPGVCSTDIITVAPSAELDRDYLFYWLRSPRVITEATEKSTGATLPRISPQALREFEVPVPPLDEQKRIAAKLGQLIERADCLERTYRSTELRASEALDSEVSAAIGDLSERYEEKLIGDVLEVARGGSPRPISEYITDDADGVNWVKIGDASASRKYIYETAEKIKPDGVKRSRKVGPGDFLLSNSMSFGRPYIMRTDGCIHDGWLVLRDKNSCFDQDYLYYLLGSTTMYSEFSRRAQGSTVQNLNSTLVAAVSIPVPPREVQERFACQVRTLEEQVHQLRMNVARRLELVSELRQSVLEAAFRGEV